MAVFEWRWWQGSGGDNGLAVCALFDARPLCVVFIVSGELALCLASSADVTFGTICILHNDNIVGRKKT